MDKKKSGMAYLLELAGKHRLHLALSALLGVLSALCAFMPYVMVYRTLMFLFGGTFETGVIFRYGMIAAAVAARFVLLIASSMLSHLGAFNTLYNVRSKISAHIAAVNPVMALCLLAPLLLGALVQGIAMAATGKQMAEYHRLQGKLNSAIMQFINGMPVMKTYNLTAESYQDFAGSVHAYNRFWKRSARSQGYPYGVFVALAESGILFTLPAGGLLYLNGTLAAQDYLFFMVMSLVFLSSLLNLVNLAMLFNQIIYGCTA